MDSLYHKQISLHWEANLLSHTVTVQVSNETHHCIKVHLIFGKDVMTALSYVGPS
jgi:hypothetical protein